ncbi:NUDIX domain-containing protein [Serinicoccus sp. CUA-874]|uniref:NUDIX domain-containing protein n=1 Tax=Serinicoccus sp. CUA-874 TaxID=1517939 RepID=UPI002AA2B171|nr:NUDIX domain-containing protein [Serinicoccus sp. CUA-874]
MAVLRGRPLRHPPGAVCRGRRCRGGRGERHRTGPAAAGQRAALPQAQGGAAAGPGRGRAGGGRADPAPAGGGRLPAGASRRRGVGGAGPGAGGPGAHGPRAQLDPGGWGAPGGKREVTDASARAAAVREVAEEIAVELEQERLVAVGYQRITLPPGHGARSWDEGDNYVQVYAATLPSPVPLRPDGVEVLEARWLSLAEARGVAGQAAWWPLAEWWWARG